VTLVKPLRQEVPHFEPTILSGQAGEITQEKPVTRWRTSPWR